MVMHVDVDRRDAAESRAAIGAAHFDRVLQADVERAPQEQQRPFEPRRGAFNREAHRCAPGVSIIARIRAPSPPAAPANRASSSSPISSPIRCSGRTHAICAIGPDGAAPATRLLGEVDETAKEAHHRALPRGTADTIDDRQCRLPQERFVDETRAQRSVSCWRTGSASLPMIRAIRSRRASSSSSARKRRREREPLAVALLGPPRARR